MENIETKLSEGSDSSVSALASVSAEQIENVKNSGLKLTEAEISESLKEKKTVQEDKKNEEDEEIRIAQAMALAIQNNPNLTPEEIRKLVGDTQKEQQENIAAVVANKKQQQPPPISLLANSFFDKKDEGKEKTSSSQALHGKNFSVNIQEFQKNIKGFVDASASKALNVKNKVTTLNPLALSSSKSAPSSPTSKGTVSSDLETLNSSKSSLIAEKKTINDDSTQEEKKFAPPDSSPQISQEEDNKDIILSSLVWKRRSGFGKYNSKAWERRRIVLKGNILQYFKEHDKDYSADGSSDLMSSTSSIDLDNKAARSANYGKTPNWLATNLESAKATMDKFAASVPHILDEDPNAPRGAMDLVKESATVGASMGHLESPTPFCISVKVRKETKWKICFDTHATQMQWLAAMTDIIVKSSVEGYNKSHDTAHVLDPDEQKKTFALDNYQIRASIFSGNTKSEEEEIGGENIDHENEEYCDEGSEPYYQISEKGVYAAAAIINLAMILTQASSSTPSHFWYITTFANLGLFCLLSKPETEKADGKSGIRKRHERLSKTKIRSPVKKSSRAASNQVTPKVIRESKTKPGFKPQAGSTCVKIDSPEDVPMVNNHRFIGWKKAETLQVRSLGYLSHKKKMPSLGPLYDVVAVDFFECSSRVPEMSTRVVLPSVQFETKAEKRWHAPDIFVVTISIPTDTPSLYGKAHNDGSCYTASMYYKMGEETRKILQRVTAEGYDPANDEGGASSMVNAVKLFDEWCRRAPNDDKFFSRFKMIFRGDNFKEIGVANWIRQYNGKPVLIKRPRETGFLYNHPELNTMEFEITLHPFPYLAKQAICYLKEKFFKKLILTVGFIIEGRSDEELPECTIGAAQLCYPDPALNIQDDDLFEGTSPKSHEDKEGETSS